MRLLPDTEGSHKPQKLNCIDVNKLLSMRMNVNSCAKKTFQIDRVLLRQGYSFVVPVVCFKKDDVIKYSFNELSSDGNRFTAWRLCKTIKLMKIEGIYDVKIPKPGHCIVYTHPDAPYSSLQKVFTLLGVYQCDIVMDGQISANRIYSFSA
jgi:hypothetical protein